MTALREQWRGVHENAALDELAAEVVAGGQRPVRRGRPAAREPGGGRGEGRHRLTCWSAAETPPERACPHKALDLGRKMGSAWALACSHLPPIKEQPMTAR